MPCVVRKCKTDAAIAGVKRFASKCKCPALFAGDTKDGVVPPAMVKSVFNKYNKKRRQMVDFTCEGSGHFGLRPASFLQTCCAFLRANLYDGKKSVPRETWPDVSDPTGSVAAGAEWPRLPAGWQWSCSSWRTTLSAGPARSK